MSAAGAATSFLGVSEQAGLDGSYRTPRFEHASVADAMRHGIFSCPADTSLREAARSMTEHHVHAVVVSDEPDGSPGAILSDRDLLGALLDYDGEERCLADVADSDVGTVASDLPLKEAAQLMRERGVSHLIVRDARSGRPAGMLSILDVAGILAWGEV